MYVYINTLVSAYVLPIYERGVLQYKVISQLYATWLILVTK